MWLNAFKMTQMCKHFSKKINDLQPEKENTE